jgi:hypothetical protein
VITEQPDVAGQFVVVGQHSTAVAVGAEVLAGVEAGRRDVAERAGGAAVSSGALGLCGVLHHDGVTGRHPDLLDRRRLPVQVHRQHRPGLRPHRGGHGGRADQPGVRLAVHQHGRATGPGHGLRGGDERVRRQDALVTRPDTGRAQRQFHRVGAVADADTVRGTEVVGILPLERGHLRPVDERGALQHLGPSGGHLVGYLAMLCGEINQWDVRHAFTCPASVSRLVAITAWALASSTATVPRHLLILRCTL